MKKDKYISKELLIHTELSELDLTLKDEFKYNWESDDNFTEIDVIKDESLRKGSYIDTAPINIKDLERLVENFKKKGVTHIQMTYDANHYGYIFSGFKIGLADDELIKRYNDERERKDVLYKEYNKLQLKMNKITNEIRNLKI